MTNQQWEKIKELTLVFGLREAIEKVLAQRPEVPAPTCSKCGNTLGCVSCSNERKAAPAQNSCDNSSGPRVIAVPSCVPAPPIPSCIPCSQNSIAAGEVPIPYAPATDAFDTEEQAVAAWNRWLDTARAVLAEVDKEAKREG